jgi:hypothetical protein
LTSLILLTEDILDRRHAGNPHARRGGSAMGRPNQRIEAARRRERWRLGLTWIGACVIGEIVGLSLAGLVDASVLWAIAPVQEVPPLIFRVTDGVLSGVVAGAVLGVGQWVVVRRYFLKLAWSSWVLATAASTGAIWSLVRGIGSSWWALDSRAASDGTLLMAAAGFGLLLGTVLGGAQWVVLRRYLQDAVWWIPATALAWMLGLVLACSGVGVLFAQLPVVLLVLIAGGTGFFMAAVTGAFTGVMLVAFLFPSYGRSRPRLRVLDSINQETGVPAQQF